MAFVTVPKDFIGVPLFFLLRGRVPTSAAALLMVFAMLPGLLLALYERHGQPLEVIAGQMIQAIFLRPKERPYQTNNLYAALMRQHQLEKEVKAIVKNRKENAPTGRRKKKADPRRTPRN